MVIANNGTWYQWWSVDSNFDAGVYSNLRELKLCLMLLTLYTDTQSRALYRHLWWLLYMPCLLTSQSKPVYIYSRHADRHYWLFSPLTPIPWHKLPLDSLWCLQLYLQVCPWRLSRHWAQLTVSQCLYNVSCIFIILISNTCLQWNFSMKYHQLAGDNNNLKNVQHKLYM